MPETAVPPAVVVPIPGHTATPAAAGRFPVGGRGRSLENLVLASQVRGVVLTRIRGEVRRVSETQFVQVPGPCDFIGVHGPTGTMLVFDTKQSNDPGRFNASEDHFSEDQRVQIVAYGRLSPTFQPARVAAGLLVESTRAGRLYWLSWQAVEVRRPSYAWDDPLMFDLGPATRAVDWVRLIEAAKAAEERS